MARKGRTQPPDHPDRAIARRYADLYRKALAAPEGVYIEAGVDGLREIYVDSKDPRILVDLLETFAKFGRFSSNRFDADKVVDSVVLRLRFSDLQADGHTKDSAIEALIVESKKKGKRLSRSTVERRLGLRKEVK